MKIYPALAFENKQTKKTPVSQRTAKVYLMVQNTGCEYKESNLSSFIYNEVGKADVLEFHL